MHSRYAITNETDLRDGLAKVVARRGGNQANPTNRTCVRHT
jgi:hypothetical protein